MGCDPARVRLGAAARFGGGGPAAGLSPVFRAVFSARMARPSIPMETFLRMMFLKYRYRLGYETTGGEVADSIA